MTAEATFQKARNKSEKILPVDTPKTLKPITRSIPIAVVKAATDHPNDTSECPRTADPGIEVLSFVRETVVEDAHEIGGGRFTVMAFRTNLRRNRSQPRIYVSVSKPATHFSSRIMNISARALFTLRVSCFVVPVLSTVVRKGMRSTRSTSRRSMLFEVHRTAVI